jgi:L-aspartate oxidase
MKAEQAKWAQGGIAAALGPGDTPDQHESDTLLVAGAGLCDIDAVKVPCYRGT